MQKLSERLNTFADAATLLMIIAIIAFAAWLLAHSGQRGVRRFTRPLTADEPTITLYDALTVPLPAL